MVSGHQCVNDLQCGFVVAFRPDRFDIHCFSWPFVKSFARRFDHIGGGCRYAVVRLVNYTIVRDQRGSLPNTVRLRPVRPEQDLGMG